MLAYKKLTVAFSNFWKLPTKPFLPRKYCGLFIFFQTRKYKVTKVSYTSETYLGLCQNIYDDAFSPEIVKVVLNPQKSDENENFHFFFFCFFVLFLFLLLLLFTTYPNNPSLWFWPKFPKNNIKKYFFSFYQGKGTCYFLEY